MSSVISMRLATGIVLLIAGTVWILQGFDLAFAPESFMTGDMTWVLWGALAALTGGILIWAELRRRSDS